MTMQLLVHGRNVEITDWIREYLQKKVGKLDRFLPQVSDARVELSHNATRAADDRYTAQITFWVNGQILRAEEATSDIFASIDAAVDKMSRQVRRFKDRRYQSKRRASVAASTEAQLAAVMVEELPDDEEEEGHIIRRKEFVLEPMNEQEALAQMELLGHDFFVYYDLEAQGVNVLYRRRDGQFGLLQPRIG
jgi:putative sigma-54 modulation protein